MINLKKDIQTVKVTTDPLSYSTFLYGPVKIGKSTFVHQLLGKKALFLMTENRERSLVGADVAKITNWTDFTSALKQLRRDKDLQEQYSAIVIDTVDNLWRFAQDFTLGHYGTEELGDVSFGKDYVYLNNIWQKALEKIHAYGYTPFFVGHSKQKTVQIPADKDSIDELGELAEKKTVNGVDYLEFLQYQPDLPEKAMNPINKMVDSILFLNHKIDKNGVNHRVINLREAPVHIAGTTFKDIPPVVTLNADSYRKALEKAVNHYDESDQTSEDYNKPVEEVDFNGLMQEAAELGKKLVAAGRKTDLTNVIDKYLGLGHKLKDAKPNQYQQVESIISDLKDLGDE